MTNVTKRIPSNNICQAAYISTRGFLKFLVYYALKLIFIILILVESDQY